MQRMTSTCYPRRAQDVLHRYMLFFATPTQLQSREATLDSKPRWQATASRSMEREEARFISRLRISISTAASNIISSGAPPLPADIGADVNVDGRADPPLAGLCLRVGSQLRAVVAGNARFSQSCAAKADPHLCTYFARSRNRRQSRNPYSQLFVNAPGLTRNSRITNQTLPDTRHQTLHSGHRTGLNDTPRSENAATQDRMVRICGVLRIPCLRSQVPSRPPGRQEGLGRSKWTGVWGTSSVHSTGTSISTSEPAPPSP